MIFNTYVPKRSDTTTDPTGALTVDAPSVRSRLAPTLATGLFGGLALGAVARAWMRLIAEEPEFTWNGTIFIVSAFTIFGVTQSIVAVARRRTNRRWTLTVARVIGVAGILPLFVGAGAVMAPTVVGGGVALSHPQWRRLTRGVCFVAAAGPLLLVGHDLVGSFGWSLHAFAGFVTMVALYATIVRATRFAFASQTDGRRLNRWVTVGVAAAVGIGFALLTAGLIFT